MARTIPVLIIALCGQFLIMGAAARAEGLHLSLPIACTPGRDCFVQQYVDDDPGSQAHDYACGAQTYDDHKGTDIRVRSLKDVARGVPVIAVASGLVTGVRGWMPDHIVRTNADRDAVVDKECGNGVIVSRSDGWQFQYCHLRKDSLAVRPGDEVTTGQRLGFVGYSGMAAFPHVHLTVRRNGEVIDPFTGLPAGTAKCNDTSKALWSTDALLALTYKPGQVLDTGFADTAPSFVSLEDGRDQGRVPGRDWPALIAWGWAINLEKGDEVVVVLTGPDGELARNHAMIDRHKAQYMLFAGKRRPEGGWPAGHYVARFEVRRDGKPVFNAERPAEIK